MKLGQILVCCTTNIPNMFLDQCWRMETSSRLFYDSIEMMIQQDVVIFNSWHLPFLIVVFSHFQKNETLDSWHGWLLSNLSRLLNWKGSWTSPSSPNRSKIPENYLLFIPCLYLSVDQVWWLNDLWFKR